MKGSGRMEYKIEKLSNLGYKENQQVAKIFIDGFGYMFKRLTKDKELLIKCFESAFVRDLFYVALDKDRIVGFVGISDNKSRAMKLDRNIFRKYFGNFTGGVFCSQIGFMMEKPIMKEAYECYIDLLGTDIEYRNKGVGTELLNYVHNELQYDEYYIEVLSKNVTAKRLYEKIGYKLMKVNNNIFLKMQGLGSAEFMKLSK